MTNTDKLLRDAIGELKKLREELKLAPPEPRDYRIYNRVSYAAGCLSQVLEQHGIKWSEL